MAPAPLVFVSFLALLAVGPAEAIRLITLVTGVAAAGTAVDASQYAPPEAPAASGGGDTSKVPYIIGAVLGFLLGLAILVLLLVKCFRKRNNALAEQSAGAQAKAAEKKIEGPEADVMAHVSLGPSHLQRAQSARKKVLEPQ